ncbi:MAG TPA: MazG nucleotide pyrophosphohydrolase domain-containing protein [Thermoleophilaceae bacterium]|nr:MazG nucleotide pyrophosphohydrolase domain-containing protein [Thermoleophilaceae bacterium]
MDEGARASLARLDEITRRLRVECPWDREQDERSIVPHTVEEAYELADAAISGDDDKLVDELGDVLFQVYFLSLLLEERGAGDLSAVAERMIEKLIRRHPHVFGEVDVDSAEGVVRNWDAIKRDESGSIFGDLPENLPALLYARKVIRRAANAGVGTPDAGGSVPGADSEGPFDLIGRRLFELVAEARELDVDPELALRTFARRYMEGATK